jgi:Flp pilus assembly protein TadD
MSLTTKIKSGPAKTTTAVSGAIGRSRWTDLGICVFLAAIVWIVFGQTLHFGFENSDDQLYVLQNPGIVGGLSWKNVAATFTHYQCGFYHPLTMLSLMLNYQLGGLQPVGYHLVNVLLHTASVLLLFLVLRQMTGCLWCSAFVAAVFAVHPLRAESVAWVAERKDVLSAFFFMLALWAYGRYVRKRTAGDRRATGDYALLLLFFVMGLLSKPSVVTLPFVLLLLDYWPLGRLKKAGNRAGLSSMAPLVVEKIPLFLLSVVTSVIVLAGAKSIAPAQGGLSLVDRLGNPLVSYVIYLKQLFCPAGLAVFYPFIEAQLTASKMVFAVVLLAAISAAALANRRRPYLPVGWFWYLGMLVPMIGTVQIGAFAHADRFTYLPQIGLSLVLAWLVTDLCSSWRYRQAVLGGGGAIIIAALVFLGHRQASYWQSAETLWSHAVACTTENSFAHNNLGSALVERGDLDDAIPHFQEALRITPGNAKAHNNLANMLLKKGDLDGAIGEYQQALQLRPNNAEIHNNLAYALFQNGSADEAISHYQQALQIKPDFINAQSGLAWVLATAPQASLRNGNEAVELARRANDSAGGQDPYYLQILAAAYAEAGRFDDAIQTGQKAMEFARMAGKTDSVKGLDDELKLYEAKVPFHQKIQ